MSFSNWPADYKKVAFMSHLKDCNFRYSEKKKEEADLKKKLFKVTAYHQKLLDLINSRRKKKKLYGDML